MFGKMRLKSFASAFRDQFGLSSWTSASPIWAICCGAKSGGFFSDICEKDELTFFSAKIGI